jgi:hypothetical protein
LLLLVGDYDVLIKFTKVLKLAKLAKPQNLKLVKQLGKL